jgi:hypothetical protein
VNCLDAETLAAWMDGGLTGAALADVQAHVAGCERCQMLLGAMGQTRAAAPASDLVPASRRWLAWAVPLTAAATAVVIWVAIPEQKQPVPSPPPTSAHRVPLPAPAEAVPIPLQKSEAPQAPAATPAAPPRAAKPQEPDSFAQQNAGTLADNAPAAPSPPAPALRAEQREANAGEVQQRAAAISRDAVAFCGPAPPAANAGQLTASSAPSADVCWLAGRGGLVLRSVDGRTWQRIDFPEPTDLTGVTATDAGNAVITDAAGRTFSTTDGGMTWTQR